jgi:hypothetical protein
MIVNTAKSVGIPSNRRLRMNRSTRRSVESAAKNQLNMTGGV